MVVAAQDRQAGNKNNIILLTNTIQQSRIYEENIGKCYRSERHIKETLNSNIIKRSANMVNEMETMMKLNGVEDKRDGDYA